MNLHPVLLDRRPSFLTGGGAGAADSLLLLPIDRERLIGRLLRQLDQQARRPLVLPTFAGSAAYAAAIRATCPAALVLDSASDLWREISALDPGEEVLLIDSACFPVNGFDQRSLELLLNGERGLTRHLVALERTSGQTKEFVHADENGRVRKIQRYYHPQTWPFASGVVCSVVPVASLLMAPAPPLASLAELRQTLATQGAPSRDFQLSEGAIDLGSEEGVLHLMERTVRESSRASRGSDRSIPAAPDASRSAETARGRVVGDVVREDDVVIEDGALVIGPSSLGRGCRIGAHAVVAQSLVMPGVVVQPGAVLRHRVVSGIPSEVSGDRWPAYAGVLQSHSRGVATLGEPVPSRGRYPAVKRIVESAVAGTALLLLAPLMAAVAVAIKLFAPGPVLFGHVREGKGGRAFSCWKFRTMRVGADALQRELAAQQQLDGPQFKIDRDPRVTTVGRWLRATNLDELPQLWNVFRGQMSLVGPRPSPFRENQVCVPWRQGRLSVLPGITGLWQVCRHDRAAGDFHQWIEYDLLYVRHMSPLVDLRILAATVLTLGGRRSVPLARIVPAAVHDRVDRGDLHGVAAGDTVASDVGHVASRRQTPGRSARSVARALSMTGSLLGLAAAAGAQTPTSLAQPAGATWSIGIASQLGVESNPAFVPAADTSDITGGLRGEARVIGAGRRGQLSLAATGAALRHRRLATLDRFSYDARAEAIRELSRRTTGRVGYRAQSQLARDLVPDVGESVIPPATAAVARAHDADGQLTYRLSPRGTVDVAAHLHRVRYDVAALASGSSASGRLAWLAQTSAVTGVGARYELQRSRTAGQSLESHELVVALGRALTDGVLTRVTAGAARLGFDDGIGAGRTSRWAPAASAELQARRARGFVTARYQRRSRQLLGQGAVLETDYLSARADRSIGRSLVAEIGADHSISRDVASQFARLRSTAVHAGLRWSRREGILSGASVFHRARSQESRVATTGVVLTAGYGWSGGRARSAPMSPGEAR